MINIPKLLNQSGFQYTGKEVVSSYTTQWDMKKHQNIGALEIYRQTHDVNGYHVTKEARWINGMRLNDKFLITPIREIIAET